MMNTMNTSAIIEAAIKRGRWDLSTRPVVAIVMTTRRYENADGVICYDRRVEGWSVIASFDGRPELSGGTLIKVCDSRGFPCVVFGSGHVSGERARRGVEAHVIRYETR
jgi:hypothetical protein